MGICVSHDLLAQSSQDQKRRRPWKHHQVTSSQAADSRDQSNAKVQKAEQKEGLPDLLVRFVERYDSHIVSCQTYGSTQWCEDRVHPLNQMVEWILGLVSSPSHTDDSDDTNNETTATDDTGDLSLDKLLLDQIAYKAAELKLVVFVAHEPCCSVLHYPNISHQDPQAGAFRFVYKLTPQETGKPININSEGTLFKQANVMVFIASRR